MVSWLHPRSCVALPWPQVVAEQVSLLLTADGSLVSIFEADGATDQGLAFHMCLVWVVCQVSVLDLDVWLLRLLPNGWCTLYSQVL